MSVSNRQGFIKQSDQFENRNVASEDTSNYKIVEKNDFAFNPARINVGSIARLTTFENGIVSPMYICFRTQENVAPEYIDFFFESKHFLELLNKQKQYLLRQMFIWTSGEADTAFENYIDQAFVFLFRFYYLYDSE